MPYYECPVCGGGYVIDPAPTHPKCDRDGATLKRASEASYTQHEREDEFAAPSSKPRATKTKR
jgi:rubredoxin